MQTTIPSARSESCRDLLHRIDYLDLPLWTGGLEAAADWLVAQARHGAEHPTLVTHINANNYYWLHRHPDLAARLRRDGVLLLDGIGLQLGGRMLGLGRLPDLNGTDLFPRVMQRAARLGLRLYLLGARDGVVEHTARILTDRFPGLRVVGHHGGYFEAAAEAGLVETIRRSGAELLLIGRGFIRQEEFALEHRSRLGVPLLWNVGGLFDFVSGARPRAPLAMRRARLEWMFRFLVAPRQMWHRNLVAAPWFVGHVLQARWAGVASRRPASRGAGGQRRLPQP